MSTASGKNMYAQVVNQQVNPNASKMYNSWKNLGNATLSSQREENATNKPAWATSYYTRTKKGKGYEYITPWVITAHSFGLDIPDEAVVNKVVVEARMKVESGLVVTAPLAHFMVYGGKGSVTSQKNIDKSGWVGNQYLVVKNTKLSTTAQTIAYEFPASELKKMKYPNSAWNQAVMGVDFTFPEPTSMKKTDEKIVIDWVRIKVYYELPDYIVQYGEEYRNGNRKSAEVGKQYTLPIAFLNRNKNTVTKPHDVTIDLPPNTDVVTYTKSDGTTLTQNEDGTYNWHIGYNGKTVEYSNWVKFWLISHTSGVKSFVSTMDGKKYTAQSYVFGATREYTGLDIQSSDVRKGQICCFDFKASVYSFDGTVSFDVTVDGLGQANPNNVSQEFKDAYHNSDGLGNYLVQWELDDISKQQGISIDEDLTTNNHIAFENVPQNTDVEIIFKGCFVIVTEGNNQLNITNNDTSDTFTYQYRALAPYDTVAVINPAEDIWTDNWLVTTVETGAYVIPFATKDTDAVMVEGDCTLKLHIDPPKAYIGCVPIKHSHYEPQSDFSNSIISEQYKNKKYMGKSGEIKEDISLKIKLPPRDWTTLQGLCELDKPVPINTVPEAFEGDVINHRGWVELGGVKNVKKTNPLYYDGELDVDYLTHNINTRFHIARGVKVTKYTPKSVKDLLDYTLNSGDEFVDYTHINEEGELVHNNTGLFNLDTDGVYIYDEDMIETQRTLVGLDNNQYVNIKSVKALDSNTKIDFHWFSTKIGEDRENNIERIVRLVNKDGLAIMEYQYYDYDFNYDDEMYNCSVRCSKLDKSLNTYTTVIEDDLNFAVDLESLRLVRDEFGNLVQQDESEIDDENENESETYVDEITGETELLDVQATSYSDYMFGSTLTLELQGNILSILDSGFNGREVYKESITLEKDKYYLEVAFKNRNDDADTHDVFHFFDFEVQETIIKSDLQYDYANLVTSSFPIPNKQFLFTRNSEEGTLYYYRNDGKPFTYIQEPFYMYYRGVDMVAGDGQSIFNLNNSYTTFYVQNGLVRIGFNRLTGRIYVAKYDLMAEEYITVAILQSTSHSDFSMGGAYSDDKITIKCGKTTFTVYRGHPYILVKHSKEDIDFVTVWNQVYSESIGVYDDDFPVLWDLVNTDNLLPACVGGLDLKASCLNLIEVENTDVGTTPTLSLSKSSPQTVYVGDLVYFDITGSVTDVDEEIPIETEYTGSWGTYESEVVVDNKVPMNMTFSGDTITQIGDVASMRAKLTDADHRGCENVRVDFYEWWVAELQISSDTEIMQTGDVAEISATIVERNAGKERAVENQKVYFYKED